MTSAGPAGTPPGMTMNSQNMSTSTANGMTGMTPATSQSLLTKGLAKSVTRADLANAPDVDLSKFSDTDLGKELIAWINTEYQKMKSARVAKQREWYINLSMYYGEQYYQVLSSAYGQNALGVPPAPKYRVRSTTNKIKPMIRTEISRLTSQKPSASVVPATGSDEDMAAAQAGEAVWEYLSNFNKFTTNLSIRHAFWLTTCGTGFWKSWWDTEKVDTRAKTPEGEPVKGNVCNGVVTPFNIFVPDHMIPDIEDEPYVFEVYTKPVSWVKQRYPEVFKDKDPQPDAVSSSEIFEPRYFQVSQGAKNAAPDACLFVEAWIKPGYNKNFPQGGLVTLCAGKIVQYQAIFPYAHQEFPYAKTIHIETGTFYGESVIKDAKHLQREYNRVRSQIIESRNRMGRPQLLIARGSLDPRKLTSEPGQAIVYNQGFAAPTPIPVSPLPAYVTDDQDRIISDLEDISGQHQASRGMSPGGGVVAATAINYLQEKDDSLMYGTYASWEAAVEKVARQTLSLVADYVDTPRIISIVGADGSFDTYNFKGASIANALDIRIEGGSSLPQSKAAKQQLLMDMAKNGFISPQEMLDMLDIGGVQKLAERLRIDQKQAQRENLKMKSLDPMLVDMHAQSMMQQVQEGSDQQQDPQGNWNFNQDPSTWPPLIQVNDWDNHMVHIKIHNDYRKGQEFELLPQGIKDQIAAHVRIHVQALTMQSQPPNMMGGQGQGTTPGQMSAPGMGAILSGQLQQPQPGQSTPGQPPQDPTQTGDPSQAPQPPSGGPQ
jgi:hypothetical protein